MEKQIQVDSNCDPAGVDYKFTRNGEPIEPITGKRTKAALIGFVSDTIAVGGAMIVTALRGIGDIANGLAQTNVIHDRSAFSSNRAGRNPRYEPIPQRREGPFGGLADALSRISQ